MKSMKVIRIISLMLCALLLFSSCAIGATSLKSMIVPDTEYASPLLTLTKSAEVADLADFSKKTGELFYFITEAESNKLDKKHVVYNLETDQIVFTATESVSDRVIVTLDQISYDYENHSYFTVQTTSYHLDGSQNLIGLESVSTQLYDANGKKLAEANRMTAVSEAIDLLYFDGKCYRAQQDSFVHAFDYSQLASFPSVNDKSDSYYYDISKISENSYVTVYDLEMNFVSKYTLPMLAQWDVCTVLENGSILLQYAVQVSDDATDYTLLAEDENKYSVHTQLIDPKSGKAKELKTEYVLDYIRKTTNGAFAQENGINTKALPAFVNAYRIEDHQATTPVTLIVGKDGAFTEMEPINGERLIDISLFDDNRWFIVTDNHRYLIDEKGKILGDVSNAVRCGQFFYTVNGIFNSNLENIYDLGINHMTVTHALANAFLLQDADGALYVYTGSGKPTEMIAKNSARTLHHCGYSYYIIADSTDAANVKYEVYSAAGTLLTTLESVSHSYNFSNVAIQEIGTSENAVLLHVVHKDGKEAYYRLS